MMEALSFDDVQITPKFSDIRSRDDVDTTTQYTKNFKLELPIVASPMDTVCDWEMALTLWKMGAHGIIHRYMSIEEQCASIKRLVSEMGECLALGLHNSEREFNPISAAIGVNGDFQERACELVKAGVNVLVIDVAHGNHQNVLDALEWLNCNLLGIDIIAGSIATADAALKLANTSFSLRREVDGLRVGVGGGSLCTTRIMTGVGIPTLHSIADVRRINLRDITVIADGGIRYQAMPLKHWP